MEVWPTAFTCVTERTTFPGSMANFHDLTGVSRCFPFWQDLIACYVMNTNAESDSGKLKCLGPRDDYYECLHHTKEVGDLLSVLGGNWGEIQRTIQQLRAKHNQY